MKIDLMESCNERILKALIPSNELLGEYNKQATEQTYLLDGMNFQFFKLIFFANHGWLKFVNFVLEILA